MRYLIIGDIHGAFGSADALIDLARKSEDGPVDAIIQVGDMGFGFPGLTAWGTSHDIPTKWVDGNHDNHEMLANRGEPHFGYDPYHSPVQWAEFLKHWQYMERGSFENGILFIGGASSIDRFHRTEGIDWWPGENISYEDEGRVLSTIKRVGAGNIHTVISHEAPTGFRMLGALQGVMGPNTKELSGPNRKFLEHVRTLVKPSRWFFGHYHVKWAGQLEGCSWRCIDMVRGQRGRDPSEEDYVIVELG